MRSLTYDFLPPIILRCIRSIKSYFLKSKNESIDLSNKFHGKIFCIGFGKTGTTSLESVLKAFGYRLGNQAAAEILSRYINDEGYDRIVRYCYTADAFQDSPFFSPGLYEVLDKAFPGSKFILTVRDDNEQWFSSLVRSHTKLFSSDPKRPPTEDDLANALYRYRGYCLDTKLLFWGYPGVPLYSKKDYIHKYESHNENVINYFKDRPSDLLVLNVGDTKSLQKLGDFLGIKVPSHLQFPRKNLT